MRTFQRIACFGLLAFIAGLGVRTAGAQSGGADSQIPRVDTSTPLETTDFYDPVTQVRNHRTWEYGPFVNWGTGVGNRSDYKFLWAGFELGKTLTPVMHAGIFSGQFQFAGDIMPLWEGYTPAPHQGTYSCDNPPTNACAWPYGGGTFHGVSITPVIFRWNFATRAKRIQPWFQAAGGLIYTTHKYPPNYMSCQGPPMCSIPVDGGTSVWNFTPQGGGGIHYFIQSKRSIDLGINGVHISSASLGDRNPGVNASVQIQVGYTFWK